MAWTTPATWVSGAILTAAQLNQQLRDNTADLRSYQNRLATSSRTAGALTVTSTTWTALNGPADLTLGASTGDILMCSLSAKWNNQAQDGFLDVATVVGGVVTNYFASAGNNTYQGIVAWSGPPSQYTSFGAPFYYTVVAGDISGGNVVLRLMTRVSGSKVLNAETAIPLVFTARNLGPVTT